MTKGQLNRSQYGDDVATYYLRFSDISFAEIEPAYHAICHGIAEDADLLALIGAHPQEAQQPNIILAAARYLLLSGIDHELAAVFGHDAKQSSANPFPLFKDLVMSHEEEFTALIATRRTQTNEVGRSGCIAASFQYLSHRPVNRHATVATNGEGKRPLAWIDLGASAGLNLLLDHFRINYRTEASTRSLGPSDASVVVNTDAVGLPDFDGLPLPSISWRVGVDRAPINVVDQAEARWLEACVWPSNVARADRLRSALALAQLHEPSMITADAVAGLGQAIEQAPVNAELVITTTWVWFYLPDDVRTALIELMRTAGRPVRWVSLEAAGVVSGFDLGDLPPGKTLTFSSVLGLHSFDGFGHQSAEMLGWSHPHGDWINWKKPMPV